MKLAHRFFFLLGPHDPEMKMIETILKKMSLLFVYASASGKRCHPGNGYAADPVDVPIGYTLVILECEPINVVNFRDVIRIDHHRPIDPGFHMGPALYWEASSIGQLHQLLDIKATSMAVTMAACDHSFHAAARGECPGVSPESAMSLGINETVLWTQTSEDYIRSRISHFRRELANAPEETIGGQSLKDLRKYHLGTGYSDAFLSTRLAVAEDNHVAILRLWDHSGVSEKIVLMNARPETVQVFLDEWAPGQRLVNTYGVPNRGYAGGYVSMNPS